MLRHRVLPLALIAMAFAAGPAAAASARVDEVMGTIVTLIAIAILLWIIGNLLTYHRYDSGGPKGGPLSKF